MVDISKFTGANSEAPEPSTPGWDYYPNEMKALRYWCGWKYEKDTKKDRWTKVPKTASGRGFAVGASIPFEFQEMWSQWSSGPPEKLSGVGFVFDRAAGLGGIDLDKILTDEGMLDYSHPYAELISVYMEKFLNAGAYIEKSVSGRGIHVIGRCSSENTRCKNGVELYTHGRYFTMSGTPMLGYRSNPEAPLGDITAVYDEFYRAIEAHETGSARANVVELPGSRSVVPGATRKSELSFAQITAAIRKSRNRLLPLADGREAMEAGDRSDTFYRFCCEISKLANGDAAMVELVARHDEWWWHAHYADKMDRDIANGVIRKAVEAWEQEQLQKQPVPADPDIARVRAALDKPSASSEAYPHAENVLRLLAEKGDTFYFDEFTGAFRLSTKDDAPGTPPKLVYDLDRYGRSFRLWSYRFIPRLSHDAVLDGVVAQAEQHLTDSAMDWLNSLEWDGVPRLNHVFQRVFGCDDNPHTRAASRNFFLSLAARGVMRESKVDTMTILEGRQGIGKSRWPRVLVGSDLVGETSANEIYQDKRDALMAMRGKLIVEMPELHGFSRTDDRTLKSFLSLSSDEYRVPYAKNSIVVRRRFVLFGTTNDDEYLKDRTGNRRYIPVKAEYVDIDLTEEERELWLAEAVHRVLAGETWHEWPAETELEQEARAVLEEWVEVLDEVLEMEQFQQPFRMKELKDALRLTGVTMPYSDHAIGAALRERRRGYSRRDTRRDNEKGNFWHRWGAGE